MSDCNGNMMEDAVQDNEFFIGCLTQCAFYYPIALAHLIFF